MNATESLRYISPELILVGFGLLVIILDLFVTNKRFLAYFSILGMVIAMIPLLSGSLGPMELFSGMIVLDPFAAFFKFLTLVIMSIIVLISIDYRPLMQKYAGEYYALLLFLAFGMMLMAESTNLLMIQLSIELVSITSYILVSFNKKDPRSSEAGLKYFLVGAIASGIMLYGMTFLYGMTGSIDLKGIYTYFNDGTADSIVVLAFLLLVLAGFGFKIAMVPFHWWVPDTYEGAPTPITAFLSVGSKAVGFAVLYRTLTMAFPTWHGDWSNILAILAVVTMTVGNIVAITQDNIKRLLAYSSIAHAGYILVGVAINSTPFAKQAVLFYLLTYYVMNLGAFIVVIIVSNALSSDELVDYSGLYKRAPGLAACLTVFLLSLTGIPPLAGFFGKYYIFAAAIDAGRDYYWLAIAVALNSAVAAYYYFRVIRQMYLVEPKEMSQIPNPMTLKVALGITLIATLLLGFFISPIYDLIQQATQMVSWY